MSLLIPTLRTFNPSQFVGLSGSSLARGLVYASGADFLVNQAGKGNGTRVGGIVVTTPQGRMLRLNGTSEYIKLGTTVGGVNLFADANNTWSIVVQVRQLVTNAYGVLVAKTDGAAPQLSMYLESGYVATSIRGSYHAVGSQIGLNPNQITLTWDGTTAYLHRDTSITGTRSVGTASEESARTICIGARNEGTSSFLSGDFGYVLIYNRAISQAEHIAILKNPGIVFAPQPRRIWIPSSGGTIHTVSYSDVGTVLDTVSCLYITPNSLSESSTPLDNITASLISSRTYTEVATTNSSFSANKITASTYLETVTGVDTYTAYIAGSSSSYDEISTPLDTYTVSLTTSVVYTETSGVLDTYTLPADPLTLTQADIDAIANAVWTHPWALNLPKWLALK